MALTSRLWFVKCSTSLKGEEKRFASPIEGVGRKITNNFLKIETKVRKFIAPCWTHVHWTIPFHW